MIVSRPSDEASLLAPVDVRGVVATATPDVTPTLLGSSYAFIDTMREQDPTTGEPWTPVAVDAVQAGLEVAP